MLDEAEAALDILDEQVDKSEDGDRPELERLSREASTTVAEAQRLAQSHGLNACGNDG
jgi:hypothetical protein